MGETCAYIFTAFDTDEIIVRAVIVRAGLNQRLKL